MLISVAAEAWLEICDFMSAPTERAAFFFADVIAENLFVRGTWLLEDRSDYEVASADHLVLSDGIRPKVIERAHATGRAVIELHSHNWPGDGTAFSNYDLLGLSEFAPHMLWRLRDRPYAAIVIGKDSFDSLIWLKKDNVEPLDAIVLSDGTRLKPTGLSLPRYQRILHDGSSPNHE